METDQIELLSFWVNMMLEESLFRFLEKLLDVYCILCLEVQNYTHKQLNTRGIGGIVSFVVSILVCLIYMMGIGLIRRVLYRRQNVLFHCMFDHSDVKLECTV